MKVFLDFILTETSLSTKSYSLKFFLLVCKLCKSLHFGSLKIHRSCLCWKVFSTYIYRNIFFSGLLLFSYISWPVNCKSWGSKFHHFYLTCLETKVRFVFESLRYCPSWKVQFQLSSTFLAFFRLVGQFFKILFWLFFQSVNCMSSVLESCNISWKCREA